MRPLTNDHLTGAAESKDVSGSPRAPLIVILGPTAVGKTELSLQLAQVFDGEVVSADSRLFYRGMDIGTAKPGFGERALVKHHLIDIAAPNETVGLAEFQDLAYRAIGMIHARGHVPLLVGGTGQYIRSVVEGWRIPRVPPVPELRAQLEKKALDEGPGALHARLAELDPSAASRIDLRNVRRVIRALEVCIVTGKPISEQQTKVPPPYQILQIGLTMDRDVLYARADQRVDRMMAAGLPFEVQRLLDDGYTWDLPAMSGLGYLQFREHFETGMALEEVTGRIKQATHSFIRRQYNWFRLKDPSIRWFNALNVSAGAIETYVRQWLEMCSTDCEP